MGNILTKNKKNIVIIFIVAALLVIGMIATKKDEYYKNYELVDGWSVLKDSVYTENVDLSETAVSVDVIDEPVYITRVIEQKIDNPMLIVRGYHSLVEVEVQVDGVTIYDYGKERYSKNRSVGGGYHFVNLPEDYVGKVINIRYVATEAGVISKLKISKLVDSATYIKGYIRENLFGILCTYVLIAVGLMCVFISLIVGIHKKEYRKIFYIGMTAIDLSIWTQVYLGYSQILVRDGIVYYYLEFLSLYIMPFFWLLYFYESVKEGLCKKILRILAIVDLVFTVGVLILEVLNILHLYSVLSTYHVLSVVCVGAIVYASFSNHMDNKKARISVCIGIVFLSTALLVELANYVVVNQLKGNAFGFSPLVFGGFTYITCMMASYMFYLMEQLEKQAKEKNLKELAYGDILTGLSNRKSCEEKLVYIDEFNVKKFAIINFDLNWLKKINDTLGHGKGDEYLCDFADVLHECIDEYGMVGRMGGDEFIAILEEGTQEIVENIINKMNSMTGNGNMPETRQMGEGISFAYGYAVSTVSEPLSSMKAYEIADTNMYKCKEEQKAGRK